MRKFLFTALIALSFSNVSYAEDLQDGTYDATVTTSSGTYTVPVEVEDGEVTHVEWPNGGNMTVNGAEVDDMEASGYNSRGDWVQIEIED